jgi:hypothetical protein
VKSGWKEQELLRLGRKGWLTDAALAQQHLEPAAHTLSAMTCCLQQSSGAWAAVCRSADLLDVTGQQGEYYDALPTSRT